jgi:hypothetical protein
MSAALHPNPLMQRTERRPGRADVTPAVEQGPWGGSRRPELIAWARRRFWRRVNELPLGRRAGDNIFWFAPDHRSVRLLNFGAHENA